MDSIGHSCSSTISLIQCTLWKMCASHCYVTSWGRRIQTHLERTWLHLTQRSFIGHLNLMPKARWCIKLLLPLYKKKSTRYILRHFKIHKDFGATLHNSFNKEDYFLGLKSHDFCNILCYHLPFNIKGLMTQGVRESIYKLAWIICWICSKDVNRNKFAIMEKKMPLDGFPSNAISHIILWNP